MLKMNFGLKSTGNLRVLCLGAHSDDIEIGCGGTILTLIQKYKNIQFYWIVFSADKERAAEATLSSNTFLSKVRKKKFIIRSYKESFFPYIGGEIKEFFEIINQEYSPDIIFTHYRHDLHQDHRLINELTWNTFRDHLIFEYEILKYDGDLGAPNFYSELDTHICHQKIQIIENIFKSQIRKPWFSSESLLSLLRLRGIESNSSSGFAEAFYCRKIKW